MKITPVNRGLRNEFQNNLRSNEHYSSSSESKPEMFFGPHIHYCLSSVHYCEDHLPFRCVCIIYVLCFGLDVTFTSM